MARQRASRERILFDWFFVSYRTLGIVGGVFLLVGGGTFYLLRAQGIWGLNPESAARNEIRKAEQFLEEALPEATEDEGLRSLGRNAEIFLQEARKHLEEDRFPESRSEAIQSQYCSRKILEHVKGEPTYTVRFYKAEGDVRIKRAGSFLWERATANMFLGVGDQVKTASNGSAQIVYFDGTITTVKPGSLVEVKELYENPSTKVRRVREEVTWGTVEASTERGNVHGSFHEVSTENAVARAEDQARFEVEFDRSEGKTRLMVQEGKAKLTTGGQVLSLRPQEYVEVDLASQVTERRDVPGAPQLQEPADQKVFLLEDPTEAVTVLRWERIPGVSRYHLQISDQSLFGDLLLDKSDVRYTTVKLPRLPEGSYYWRVRAIDSQDLEGGFSETRKFRIRTRLLRNTEDRTPPPLDIVDFLPSGPLVIINGRTEPGALILVNERRVDVYEDGSFTAVVRLGKEGVNHLQIQAQDSAGNTTSVKKSVYVESF